MDYRLHDIQQLARFLEAEACGRPFDRDSARRLAESLAADQPEIGNTLRLMTERLAQGGKSH